MNLLLDTCGLLALAGGAGKLPARAAQAISDADQIFVGAVSAWDIAIKARSGKLRLSCPVRDWFAEALSRYHLEEIALSSGLLCEAADLPPIHRDPFDRVLVAMALEQNLAIITSDRIIPGYPGVRVIW